jgi:hypothetical protein
MELLTVTDSPEEALQCVLDCYERRCAHDVAAPEKADAQ